MISLFRLSFLFGVAAASLAFAAAPARPNILFVISDDQSWAHTSFAGDRMVKTLHFDRVAREGAYFPHSFCSSPSCTPSRGAVLTFEGRDPQILPYTGNGLTVDRINLQTPREVIFSFTARL